jgi:hypothetical protein
MFARILLLVSLFLCGSQVSAQVTCGRQPEMPPDVSRTFKGDIEGRAQLFTKLFGDASLGGKIEESKNQVYQKYSNVDKSTIDNYMAWISCQNIMSDSNLTSIQKTKLWMDVYREIMSGGKRNELPSAKDLSVIITPNIQNIAASLHLGTAGRDPDTDVHYSTITLKNNSDSIIVKNVKVLFEMGHFKQMLDQQYPSVSPDTGYEIENWRKDKQINTFITSGAYTVHQLVSLEDHKIFLKTRGRIVWIYFRVTTDGFAGRWNVRCNLVPCKCCEPIAATLEQ